MFYLFYLSTFKKKSQVSVSRGFLFLCHILLKNKQYLDTKRCYYKPSDFRLRKDNEKYEVQLLSGLHPENKGQRSG